jgi:endonuclease/exonuclease/phosphatase family metal-dependent hydrolase
MRGGKKRTDKIRIAQAKRVRSIVKYLTTKNPQINIAVLGDFNDLPGSRTLQILEGNQTKFPLYNLLKEVPKNIRYTYKSRRRKSLLDYILLSSGMKEEYIKNSVRIFHRPKLWEVSDHSPVWAKFKIGD